MTTYIAQMSILLSSFFVFWHYDELRIVWPLLAACAMVPAISWSIHLPFFGQQPEKLNEDQEIFLHVVSRKTWNFFETFVGQETNWLAPDNYQESPLSEVAHRTSSTNMGCSLLANMEAYDFGYISAERLIERTQRALKTMKGLERFRGHFYNWYDTSSLEPLQPRYVSSVDSGNLAGFALTLEQGLVELLDQKILSERVFAGLRDTLEVVKYHANNEARSSDDSQKIDLSRQLIIHIYEFVQELESPPENLSATWLLLDRHMKAAEKMIDGLGPEEDDQTRLWLQEYTKQIKGHMNDLNQVAAWILIPKIDIMLPTELQEEWVRLESCPSLQDLPEIASRLLPQIDRIAESCQSPDLQEKHDFLLQLGQAIKSSEEMAGERIDAIKMLAEECRRLADIEYDFLFDQERQLLAIGYNVNDQKRDKTCYDLLASESRLSSYVAIANGKLKQNHWCFLSRPITKICGELALLSWGATMFEYLMPLLIMPAYEDSLIGRSCKAAVKRQIEYGKERGVPWGISESGYNFTDANLLYQYRTFGVPGLGFRQGLADDLVVAPYASALALMVEPVQACINMQKMAKEGFLGKYGFYEAIDYTPARLPLGQTRAIVRSFMAHHQAMSFLAFAHALLGQPMQRRFMANADFRSVDHLLQEKMPEAVPIYPQ